MLVQAENLTCRYGALTAVNQINLTINAGEALGLVGESGCGKTTLARALVGLNKPASGQVIIKGQKLVPGHHTGKLQMIFQDPASSLNPRRTVWQNISVAAGEAQRPRLEATLSRVELPREVWHRLPGTLSGGQQQRAAIARALMTRPDFLVCDEPTAALDMSARADIINLLNRLSREEGIALLCISHDLRMVRSLCDRIAVMEGGKLVEEATAQELFSHPAHPRTKALLAAIPKIPGRGKL